MEYKIIDTGSKGNALLLEDKILIDCGVSYKKLKNETFQIVLLTHEHGDHFNKTTIRQLANNRPMLRWCCPPYLAVKLYYDCSVPLMHIDIIDPGDTLDFKQFKISTVDLIHDVPNCGYSVDIGGEKALYMTDTGTADHITAKDYDYYFIEANYKEEELKERIEKKLLAGEFSYETRVADTHLSEEQARMFIALNAKPDSKVIYMHKHIDILKEVNDEYKDDINREIISASE